jgi:hypothetical protein
VLYTDVDSIAITTFIKPLTRVICATLLTDEAARLISRGTALLFGTETAIRRVCVKSAARAKLISGLMSIPTIALKEYLLSSLCNRLSFMLRQGRL